MSVLTVNGPTTLPAGPLNCGGVMVRLGGGGCASGPAVDDVVHDGSHGVVQRVGGVQHVASVKNQMAACTAAAFWLRSVRAAGSSVFG